jgi:hypothetical protein
MIGGGREPARTVKLLIDGKQAASAEFKTHAGFFGLEGVVTVGRDIGRPALETTRHRTSSAAAR